MFVVLMRFSEDRANTPQRLAGSLAPQQGGAVLAHSTSREVLLRRVNEDSFVARGVVHAEILDIAASRSDERLHFLLDR